MLVFRELRRTVESARLIDALLRDIAQIQFASSAETSQQSLESALLSAGELECGLHDFHLSNADASEQLHLSARLTDLLARALIKNDLAESRGVAASAEKNCRQLRCPPTFELSSPEGFCFYALHPLAYAELALRLTRELEMDSVAVIGIRTIGTTLSAVVAAALQSRLSEDRVGRITVRPVGHPYGRTTSFRGEELSFVRSHSQRNSIFLVVDEGPGLSGSSFLSVGEALHELGVPHDRIIFLSSREVSPDALVAENGGARWRKFRNYAVSPATPSFAAANITDWRQQVFSQSIYASTPYRDRAAWPAVWTSMSSPKCFSADLKAIYKFEGLGRFGAALRECAALVAAAGFGPAPSAAGGGYSAYPMVEGGVLSTEDVSQELLNRIARYLAFRSQKFSVESALADQPALEHMARFNFSQITGNELNSSFHLERKRPVIADARMMPHEWLRLENGDIWKLDAAAHGDNHFFPGPTDIAWDLAGVIVEWELDDDATEHFLQSYQQLTGDNPAQRLPDYLIAYTAFHAGYAKMAAASIGEEEECGRLLRDYRRYRELLSQCAARQQQSVASGV